MWNIVTELFLLIQQGIMRSNYGQEVDASEWIASFPLNVHVVVMVEW
jgi:hypothetical protein